MSTLDLAKKEFEKERAETKGVLILVHNRKNPNENYNYLYDLLLDEFLSYVKANKINGTIDIFNIHIRFYKNSIYNCAGIRPDYYFVDTLEAFDFIQQSAAKCNGKRLYIIDKIVEIVKEVLDKSGEKGEKHEETNPVNSEFYNKFISSSLL